MIFFAKLYARHSFVDRVLQLKRRIENLCKLKYMQLTTSYLQTESGFLRNYYKHKFILNVQFKFVKIDKNVR